MVVALQCQFDMEVRWSEHRRHLHPPGNPPCPPHLDSGRPPPFQSPSKTPRVTQVIQGDTLLRPSPPPDFYYDCDICAYLSHLTRCLLLKRQWYISVPALTNTNFLIFILHTISFHFANSFDTSLVPPTQWTTSILHTMSFHFILILDWFLPASEPLSIGMVV